MISKTCIQCGAGFKTYPSTGRKWCSSACHHLSLRKTAEQTFNSFVRRADDPAACWEWTGRLSTTGYGQINLRKNGIKTVDGAHRVAYRLYIGPIPKGLFVCHTCDNTRCCNPAHLFVGTQSDNMVDMVKKGRNNKSPDVFRRGTDSNLAKLTVADVLAIRANTENTLTVDAARYGVARTTIWAIRHRVNWRHIP